MILTSLLLIMNHVYGRIFNHRGDGSNSIIYEQPSDLIGINVRHGYFSSYKGYRLFYNVYKKEGIMIKATLLVIHGIGFGHQYMLPMIKKFCEDGYLVIAYDQFASAGSEGRAIKTMTRGLKDIPFVLDFIKGDSELSRYPLYAFGHSWGGFIAFSTLRYSNDIKKVISISGFTNEGTLAPKFAPFIRLRTFFLVGKDAFYDNRKSVQTSNAKMLYLQGENDLVVNPRFAGKKYEKLIKKNPNLSVELLPSKGHTPYNDDASQKEQDKVLSEFGLLGGVYVSNDHLVDFRKISGVDENVYKKIIDFYNN